MELTYKILWFEDTDESFESLSRQTQRYVEKKTLYCSIQRIMGLSDFEMSDYDFNGYDLLVVDLQLANGSKGFEIVKKIRNSGFVNDILFYSSAGMSVLKETLREYELEGVFLSEREARIFMETIKKLIDKSVRRSENVVNIRGIVMDETSGFDNQMADITLKLIEILTPNEEYGIKKYVRDTLLANQLESYRKLLNKYNVEDAWDYAELFDNHAFSSYLMARLVNKILNTPNNSVIVTITESCKETFPELYESGKLSYADSYYNDILFFRNRLAHVKTLDSDNPPLVCKRDNQEYKCDEKFCEMMRGYLIRYGTWLSALSEAIDDRR